MKACFSLCGGLAGGSAPCHCRPPCGTQVDRAATVWNIVSYHSRGREGSKGLAPAVALAWKGWNELHQLDQRDEEVQSSHMPHMMRARYVSWPSFGSWWNLRRLHRADGLWVGLEVRLVSFRLTGVKAEEESIYLCHSGLTHLRLNTILMVGDVLPD